MGCLAAQKEPNSLGKASKTLRGSGFTGGSLRQFTRVHYAPCASFLVALSRGIRRTQGSYISLYRPNGSIRIGRD
jgi:hypothetical protein